ncbi:hypothetical protein [Phenylobacterium sp.]|uniref:hypothetical protein n=1 Tax=Phenylobacterium sp. TaxID=1871053 RepID=UPI002ED7D374
MELSEGRRVLERPGLLPNLAVAVAAVALPAYASIVNMLQFNRYPLLAAELWPIYAVVAAAALAGGALYLASPRPLRILLEAALVAALVDLNTEGLAPLAAFAITLLVSIFLRRPLAPLLAFAGLVLFGLCVAGVGIQRRPSPDAPPLAAGAPDRPAILHLILDEHVGVEGLHADNPRSPQRREQLKAFYLSHGFHLYGGAFSRHMRTTNSVPEVMNFGATQPVRRDNRDGGLAVRRNAYFDRLRTLGYRVAVYQNGWVNLCAHDREIRCLRYPETGLDGVWETALSRSDKSALVAYNLLALSAAGRRIARWYDRHVIPVATRMGVRLPPIANAQHDLTSSLEALRQARRLTADLAGAQPGQAYVAHLLLPHYPYVAREDCTLKPRREWRHRRQLGDLRQREDASFEQVLCASRIVEEAVAALERSPARNGFVVIVHGDHGSRITRRDPTASQRPDDSDLVASYATIFAVRAPGVAPGYEAAAAPIDRLLADLVAADFARAPRPHADDRRIVLEDRLWRPTRAVLMPESWAPVPAPGLQLAASPR